MFGTVQLASETDASIPTDTREWLPAEPTSTRSRYEQLSWLKVQSRNFRINERYASSIAMHRYASSEFFSLEWLGFASLKLQTHHSLWESTVYPKNACILWKFRTWLLVKHLKAFETHMKSQDNEKFLTWNWSWSLTAFDWNVAYRTRLIVEEPHVWFNSAANWLRRFR